MPEHACTWRVHGLNSDACSACEPSRLKQDAPSLLHLHVCTHTRMHMYSDAWHAPAYETSARSSERGLTGASNTSEAQVQHIRFQSVYCLHLRFSSVNPPGKIFTAGLLEIESIFFRQVVSTILSVGHGMGFLEPRHL